MLVIGGLSAVVLVPVIIALGVVREPRWSPVGDMALIELRVRDVGFEHPPLVGPGGRLEGFGSVGSHPGPVSFFALAPVYRVLGADGWALQVASVTLSSIGVVLAVWIGYRRGGWRFALATAGALVLLLRVYGAWRLVEAWNPYLSLVWWFVFLLAVWSILCDDLPMLPVAVFAGSFCSQSHVSYLALVAGLGGLTALGLGRRWFALRDRPALWRRQLRWLGVAAALAGLLWLPPLIEQLFVNHPGNVAIIIETFQHPSGEQAPFGDALDAWIRRLDIGELFTTDRSQTGWHPEGSPRAGVVSLGAWMASAVVAWRRHGSGTSALVRLHLVTGVALVLGLVAISRIVGTLWSYLMLWAWGTTALMALAIVWTVVSKRPEPSAETADPAKAPEATDEADPVPVAHSVPELRWPTPTVALVGLAAFILGTLFAVDAAHTRMPGGGQWKQLTALSDTVLPVLDEDLANCDDDDDDCAYLVTATDRWMGYGLIAELERQGYDARTTSALELGVRSHRIIEPEDADAVIHLAVGGEAIGDARSRPDAEEVAYAEPSSTDALALRRELIGQLVPQLRIEGYDDLAARLSQNPLTRLPVRRGMSDDLIFMIYAADQYRRPAALFLIVPS